MIVLSKKSRLSIPCLIPATRFTTENSGGHHFLPYPWKDHPEDRFCKVLDKGWALIGYAMNSDLALGPRRYEGKEKFIAVMFRNPDGFDYFFHMGDYPYTFVEL